MRIENMTLTIKMPLPINKPDRDGLVYTKKACIEGFRNAKNKPFIIMQKDGTQVPSGVIQNITYVENKDDDYLLIDVNIFDGGACEYILDVDRDNFTVTSMEVASVGIGT